MSKSNSFENDLLLLIFNATAIAGIAQNHGTPNANVYMSLHTGDPGEAGTQTTSEATYSNYARVAIARTSGGWTVSGNNASNTAAVTFPTSGGTQNTITHFGIGENSAGAGDLFYKGTVTPNIVVDSGGTPTFAIGDVDINED